MENKSILLENINRQRKLMGLNENINVNEFLDANVDAKGALSGNKVDLGIVPMEEDTEEDEDKEDVAENMDTLNELKWFKDKINKLRNRFGKSQQDATPYGNNIIKLGAIPVDSMDHKIANDINNDIPGDEIDNEELPDNGEYPGAMKPSIDPSKLVNIPGDEMDNEELPDNGEYPGDISQAKPVGGDVDVNKLSYAPKVPSMGAKPKVPGMEKGIAPRKPVGQPIKTSEPILGMDTHPTGGSEPTPSVQPGGAPGKPGLSGTPAKSVSNPKGNYKLNYNIK